MYSCRPCGVRRRLTLETPSFYSRTSASVAGGDYYVPESPSNRQDHYWGPGQVIPSTSPSDCDAVSTQPYHQGDADVKSLLQGLQSSVENIFEEMKKKLGDLENRVAKVEEKQVQLQNSPSSSDYNSSSSQSDTRKKRSPPDLQVYKL